MLPALLLNVEKKEESNMVASLPIKIGSEVVKQVTKKAAKKAPKKIKKTKKERAKDAIEESIRLEQGLGLYEVPIAGLKAGGIVDRNYLKGR